MCDPSGIPLAKLANLPHLIPEDIVVDSRDNLYYFGLPEGRMEKISAEGKRSLIPESPVPPCFPPKKCPPSNAKEGKTTRILRPASLATRPGGLYILDGGAHRVYLKNLSGRALRAHGRTIPPAHTVSVAGDGTLGEGGDGGPAGKAEISGEGSLAWGGGGSLYISDTRNGSIRRVDSAGVIHGAFRPVEGRPAECCSPRSKIVSDGHGNLFILSGGVIWFVNHGKRAVRVLDETVPGGARKVILASGRTLAQAQTQDVSSSFRSIGDLAYDRRTNRLFVSDPGDNTISEVMPDGTVETVAGTGQAGFNGEGRDPRLTTLSSPSALAIDRCGNLLIADRNNERIRRLNFHHCPEKAPPEGLSAARSNSQPNTVRYLIGLAVFSATLGALAIFLLLRRRWS